ncbi:metal ABC transporter solute-binding protein, Zn/Mn family [Geomicrobium sediminis]|uniref:Zinc transport system substrate-binding protein n=1 Tax=Geomicrobium sediminis TaxID=1347788 RepID=A0ABS2P7T8_9BACL|nr:zinc ABC transporter substrate-binding protein [Geomicrobium sediminis]MBM7631186.1 zinc transport system substrate-binding protein [Geomicrobium sediminis]
MRKFRLVPLSIVLPFLLIACSDDQTPSENDATDQEATEPLQISTTLFALEDFTSRIGGEHVEVESVYPPNADAHTFDPSSSTYVKIAEDDAFIYSGVGMEPFADTIHDLLDEETVEIISAGEHLSLRGEHGHDSESDHSHDHEHEHEHDHDHNEDQTSAVDLEGINDHYHTGDTIALTATADIDVEGDVTWYTRDSESDDWSEASTGKSFEDTVDTDGQQVYAAFIDDEEQPVAESETTTIHIDDHDEESGAIDPHVFLDPIYSIELAENIMNQLSELRPEHEEDFVQNYESLKADLEQLDASLQSTIDSADHKQIIVSHAAYGYWEDRYGIEQLSIHGLSSTQEPSQSELTSIVEAARENNLSYVVFENNVSSTISEVIQSEIGAESLVLRNMESISQEDYDAGEDYVSMMEMNIETLETALNH